MNFQRIHEMSHPSSKTLGRVCANILNTRRKNDPNWQSEETLNDVVIETLKAGTGDDENVILMYSVEEKSQAKPFEAFLDNMLAVIKRQLESFINSQTITKLRDLFKRHFNAA